MNRSKLSAIFTFLVFGVIPLNSMSEDQPKQNPSVFNESINNKQYLVFSSKGQRKNQIQIGDISKGSESRERKVSISENQNRVLIVDTFYEVHPDLDNLKEFADKVNETSELKVFNNEGTLLWEKKLPDSKYVSKIILQKDGTKTFAIEMWSAFNTMSENEPYEQLVVYDDNGTVICKFPDNRRDIRIDGDKIIVSPSGNYVAVDGLIWNDSTRKRMCVAIDLSSGIPRIVEGSVIARSITDNGILNFYNNKILKVNTVSYQNEMAPLP